MAYVPPGYIQAAYRYALDVDPEPMVITCGHSIDQPALGATGDDFATDLSTQHLNSLVFNERGIAWTYLGVELQWRPAGGGDLLYGEAVASSVGTRNADPLPANCAMLVRKASATAARKKQGRFFFPMAYLSEVDVARNGVIAAARQITVQTMLDGWFNSVQTIGGGGIGAVGYPPVVLRKDAVSGPPTLVSSFALEPLIATQRRRLRR